MWYMPVKAYDAATNGFVNGILTCKDGAYAFAPKPLACDPEIYLSPGFIDMHTHILDGFGVFGTNADEIGYKTGTCLTVDAGTVGAYTIDGFRKYVEPTIQTNVKLFLCISPIGVIYHHEYNAMQYLDPDEAARVVSENRDVISGVKVRIGSEVIRHEGVEPLRLASEAARKAGVPMMVHVGGLPPYITQVEPYMEKGDIITHCFNGRGGDMWNADGSPSEAVQKMLARGVILDVGHGGGSFSFDVCERAVQYGGLPKFSIGTDLHSGSRLKYAISMPDVLSKMYGIGLPLNDILYGVTALPAQILGLADWCALDKLENATLFRMEDRVAQYHDCHGGVRTYDKRITPVGVILRGQWKDLA